ncbi:MAG: hypothetical protein NT051_03415 [Candidatus Micrarchaeota archaeon]|nr:hypothetical protein [Candidatus Micrarchaeota archaeon]
MILFQYSQNAAKSASLTSDQSKAAQAYENEIKELGLQLEAFRNGRPAYADLHSFLSNLISLYQETKDSSESANKENNLKLILKMAEDFQSSFQPFELCGLKKSRQTVYPCKKTSFNLQAGDLIKADRSPYGTSHNHWGIVVEIQGELKVIARGEYEIRCYDIGEFLKFAHGIEKVRYGNAQYGEQFHVSYSKGKYTAEKIIETEFNSIAKK